MASQDPIDKEIAELKAMLKDALKRIAALEAENKKLRAKLNMNSSNSSRPPSSDPPWTSINKNQAKRDRKKRRRGGQKGHKGSNRELLPQEKVDHIDVCKPARCKECGKKLHGDDPEPQRHQVWDLRDFASFVTEYQLHALDCTCGARTRAALPEGVSQGQIGPKLIALIALLTGKYRLSKRAIPELLYDLLGVTFSVGTIANVEQLVSDALAAQVEEAEQYVRNQRWCMPTKQAGERRTNAPGCGSPLLRWWWSSKWIAAERRMWPERCWAKATVAYWSRISGVATRG